MCQSKAEGGQRCAAHASAAMEKATNAQEMWDAMIEYASTVEGLNDLARRPGIPETIISSGQALREQRRTEHAELLRKTPLTSQVPVYTPYATIAATMAKLPAADRRQQRNNIDAILSDVSQTRGLPVDAAVERLHEYVNRVEGGGTIEDVEKLTPNLQQGTYVRPEDTAKALSKRYPDVDPDLIRDDVRDNYVYDGKIRPDLVAELDAAYSSPGYRNALGTPKPELIGTKVTPLVAIADVERKLNELFNPNGDPGVATDIARHARYYYPAVSEDEAQRILEEFDEMIAEDDTYNIDTTGIDPSQVTFDNKFVNRSDVISAAVTAFPDLDPELVRDTIIREYWSDMGEKMDLRWIDLDTIHYGLDHMRRAQQRSAT